jgi:SAM-dependent methyltransferase
VNRPRQALESEPLSDRRLPGADLRALLRPSIPTETSPQILADSLVGGLVDRAGRGAVVIDLGCGRGDSVQSFRAADPTVRWFGLDLEGSTEFAERTASDAEFITFDGVSLPFDDASVDVVFCKQVLEHVERPRELTADVARVLRPGGRFAGSTSHLEPFHSRSTGNWTPYGLKRLLEDTGFEVEFVLPGIDGPTLIARSLTRAHCFNGWWSRRSPLNALVDGAGRILRWDAEDRNTVKLQFSGHFAFVARRRAE